MRGLALAVALACLTVSGHGAPAPAEDVLAQARQLAVFRLRD